MAEGSNGNIASRGRGRGRGRGAQAAAKPRCVVTAASTCRRLSLKKFNDLKRDIDASRNLAEDVLKEVLKRAKQYKQFDFLFVQFNVRCGFVLVEDYGFGH